MIYKFKPIQCPKIWGTEIWVLSGYKGLESVVSEGPAAGKTLNQVFGGEFPLLVKFIDARDDLSIQVHPSEELAMLRHHAHGKNEMWYIIDTKNDSHLYAGLKTRISSHDYVELVAQDRICEVIADHKIESGDVFYIPTGRVHAICGGTFLAEIQQTSDITYRIYDYGRKDADGKPRELHTELAKDSLDYEVYDDYRTHYPKVQNEKVQLVKCPYFTTELLDLTEPFRLDPSAFGRFVTFLCVGGEGSINGTGISLNESMLFMPDTEKDIVIWPSSHGLKLLVATV